MSLLQGESGVAMLRLGDAEGNTVLQFGSADDAGSIVPVTDDGSTLVGLGRTPDGEGALIIADPEGKRNPARNMPR